MTKIYDVLCNLGTWQVSMRTIYVVLRSIYDVLCHLETWQVYIQWSMSSWDLINIYTMFCVFLRLDKYLRCSMSSGNLTSIYTMVYAVLRLDKYLRCSMSSAYLKSIYTMFCVFLRLDKYLRCSMSSGDLKSIYTMLYVVLRLDKYLYDVIFHAKTWQKFTMFYVIWGLDKYLYTNYICRPKKYLRYSMSFGNLTSIYKIRKIISWGTCVLNFKLIGLQLLQKLPWPKTLTWSERTDERRHRPENIMPLYYRKWGIKKNITWNMQNIWCSGSFWISIVPYRAPLNDQHDINSKCHS